MLSRRIETNRTPLTDDQLRTLAPSVYAQDRHAETSHRYTFISTQTVLDAMRRAGFLPIRASQTRVRKDDHRDYTKHLIVFRRADDFQRARGELVPEVVLVNSHDGTSSYQLHAGIFRLVCSNGLIVADGTLSNIKVRHSGDVARDVIDAAYEVIDNVPQVMGAVEDWRSIQLDEERQLAYARAALLLRYDEGEAPIRPAQLVRARRSDDRKNDLWMTFNVVQENMVKGGLRGYTKTAKRTSTRAVNSVTENVRLNKALWTLTEEMAKLAR